MENYVLKICRGVNNIEFQTCHATEHCAKKMKFPKWRYDNSTKGRKMDLTVYKRLNGRKCRVKYMAFLAMIPQRSCTNTSYNFA